VPFLCLDPIFTGQTVNRVTPDKVSPNKLESKQQMRCWSITGIGRRPASDFRRQKWRKPLRCQATKVFGLTTVRASRQFNQRLSSTSVRRVGSSARRDLTLRFLIRTRAACAGIDSRRERCSGAQAETKKVHEIIYDPEPTQPCPHDAEGPLPSTPSPQDHEQLGGFQAERCIFADYSP